MRDAEPASEVDKATEEVPAETVPNGATLHVIPLMQDGSVAPGVGGVSLEGS